MFGARSVRRFRERMEKRFRKGAGILGRLKALRPKKRRTPAEVDAIRMGDVESSDTDNETDHYKTLLIKQEIISNNCEGERFRLAELEEEDERIKMGSNEGDEVDFYNMNYEALSPDQKSPELSPSRIARISSEMGQHDTKIGNVTHISLALSVVICFERYLAFSLALIHNGGWYFMIPFLFFCVTVSVPVFCLEIFLGQFTSRMPENTLTYLLPILKGAAFMFPVARIVRTLSVRVDYVAMHIVNDFIFSMFFGDRERTCKDRGRYCTAQFDSSCDAYIDKKCYKIRRSLPFEQTIAIYGRKLSTKAPRANLKHVLDNPESINAERIGLMVILVLSLYCLSRMSMSRFSKISAFTFLIPLASLITIWASVGQQYGLSYYVSSDPSALLDFRVWRNALEFAVELFTIGDGSLFALGMLMPFNYNSYRVIATLIPSIFMMIVLSLGVAIPVLNAQYNKNPVLYMDIEEETMRHAFLDDFINFQTDYLSPLVTITFAVGLFVSQFPYLVLALNSCRPALRIFWHRMRYLNETVGTHCFLGGLCIALVGLLTLVNRYGILVLFWPKFESQYIVAVICVEVVAISTVYGVDRFAVNISTMLGNKWIFVHTYRFLRISWKYITPLVLMLRFAHMATKFQIDRSELCLFILTASPFLSGLVSLIKHNMHRAAVVLLFKTSPKFGPTRLANRRLVNYDQKAARIIVE